MAPWITHERVGALLQADLSEDTFIGTLIDQVQGLIVAEVGEVASPSTGLLSLHAQITARMWQAGKQAAQNPAGDQMVVTGPFTTQAGANAGAAGLGLTNREKAALRKAAGVSGLWVQPMSRDEHLETPGSDRGRLEDTTDPIDQLAGAQANMSRPRRRP